MFKNIFYIFQIILIQRVENLWDIPTWALMRIKPTGSSMMNRADGPVVRAPVPYSSGPSLNSAEV